MEVSWPGNSSGQHALAPAFQALPEELSCSPDELTKGPGPIPPSLRLKFLHTSVPWALHPLSSCVLATLSPMWVLWAFCSMGLLTSSPWGKCPPHSQLDTILLSPFSSSRMLPKAQPLPPWPALWGLVINCGTEDWVGLW